MGAGRKTLIGMLVLLCSSAAMAALSVYMPHETVARQASIIVEGRVAEVASGLDPDSNTVATYITLDVEAVHRGPAGLERLTLREPGGTYAGLSNVLDAVPVRELGLDLASVAGHKLYAPKGVGALYIRGGRELPPLLLGAGQLGLDAGEQGRLVSHHPVEIDVDRQHLGVFDDFEIVVSGDTLPKRKPDPLPLLYAAEYFGVAPQQALMVGDSVSDVQAARAAGFQIVCMSYGYNHGVDIRSAEPDAVIDRLTEIQSLLEAAA